MYLSAVSFGKFLYLFKVAFVFAFISFRLSSVMNLLTAVGFCTNIADNDLIFAILSFLLLSLSSEIVLLSTIILKMNSTFSPKLTYKTISHLYMKY